MCLRESEGTEREIEGEGVLGGGIGREREGVGREGGREGRTMEMEVVGGGRGRGGKRKR